MKVHIFLLIILAFAGMSFGENITVSYSGFIDYSAIPNISVGDPFSGYFTYSVPSPILADSSPTDILYSMNQPGDGLFFTVDGYSFTAAPSTNLALTSWDSYPAGAATYNFLEVSQNASSSGAAFSSNYSSDFTFEQSDAQFFADSLLQSNAPPDPFNPSDVILGPNAGYFTAAGIDLQQDGSLYGAFGMIDQVQATETPEPACFPLYGFGLALIFLKRARRLNRVGRRL